MQRSCPACPTCPVAPKDGPGVKPGSPLGCFIGAPKNPNNERITFIPLTLAPCASAGTTNEERGTKHEERGSVSAGVSESVGVSGGVRVCYE